MNKCVGEWLPQRLTTRYSVTTVRRGLILRAAILLLLGVLPATGRAGDFACITNSDRTVTLSKFTGSGSTITIPESIGGARVTKIGDSTFIFRGVTSVAIPEGVTEIGASAFFCCQNLTNVVLPESLNTIGRTAFVDCSKLPSVNIPSGVTNIGWGVFLRGGLTNITVDPRNAFYSSIDGVLFNKARTKLLRYPAAKAGNYTVPDGVATVADGAFAGSTGLATVILPASVTNLEHQAFVDCDALTGMYFTGDAPAVDPTVFESHNSATVYHLKQSKGWEATLEGRPTKVWHQ